VEEGKWAARVLSEISSARASIAASYLALWRREAQVAPPEHPGPPAVLSEDEVGPTASVDPRTSCDPELP
jgi:hypothetical protein